MTQKEKLFIGALIVFLILSFGMHKIECRRVVHLKCIGKCTDFHDCDAECKHRGYTRGECAAPDYLDCCCIYITRNFND
ncbi:unnamed protein product [Lathyrus oleraceus]